MKRIKEEFLDKLETVITLKRKDVLEIGCGAGNRSVQIAGRVAHLTAIDPSVELINEARIVNNLPNITYQAGCVERLKFKPKTFDIVIFTLSLHHVDPLSIPIAIRNAIKVTKKRGYIVFFEPAQDGSFFESEILFNACDGDERKEKAYAYYSLLNYKGYKEVAEIADETVFQFESYNDYVVNMKPNKNKKQVKEFLERHKYRLVAARRINVFKVV